MKYIVSVFNDNQRAFYARFFIELEVRVIKGKQPEVNDQIRDSKVRVISNDGEQVGIMSAKEAVDLAFSRGFDLIKVAPQAEPPVCKMMDYGKYKYEQAKKAKRVKKNSNTVKLKETRLSLKIEDHDLNTKARKARGFLDNGNKVKVALKFKGREMGHTDLAYDVFDRFFEFVGEENFTLDKKPKMEGRFMVAYLGPKSSN